MQSIQNTDSLYTAISQNLEKDAAAWSPTKNTLQNIASNWVFLVLCFTEVLDKSAVKSLAATVHENTHFK